MKKLIVHVCSVCSRLIGKKGYCPKHPNAIVDSVMVSQKKK